jgi:CHAD domain-containing protein
VPWATKWLTERESSVASRAQMAAPVSERRRTLAAREGFELPNLRGEQLPDRVFTAFHYDTSDGLLRLGGLSLTRRLENGRSLWQLEIPRGDGRAKVVAPGGPTAPPARIRKLLLGVVRGHELELQSTARTRRAGVRVEQRKQSVANVLVDDVSVLEGQRVVSGFKRLHVRPLNGEAKALDRIEAELRSAGARPESKAAESRPDASAPTADHVRERIAQQFAAILAHDPGLRLGGDPENLHRLRVAVRRTRALLRSASALLDREWADHLRAELGWLGRSVGPLRDLDVLHDELRQEAGSLDELDTGGCERMLDLLQEQRAAARGDALKVLRSQRYLRLLDSLEEASGAVPMRAGGATVAELAATEFARLRKTMRALGDRPTDEALHKARIRAKRARYAAEVAEAAVGKRAATFVRRAKAFQDVVGGNQDSVVAEEAIRRLGRGSGTRAAFVAGRLVERQKERRRLARRSLPKAWKKLERAGKRAWA